ncbi:S1 family peptidase [Pseudobacteriovorax antillogorgiicola]|uniref:V8-like Glu-specific endopeptidase n=1 Tax=Pseudobacteriovorax antillogorgiicola TaxID=1513793 RepID=A0A1Y6CE69_9BACT|nr:serine protease [Pseudobacteriovorax antillogorgiicola]TCS51797.1 V8-like Glu-specific endopeptidase [Pseudobacteriovorax antillogorgiicola]SMF50056.1 V8-like Glu-specific endopeptidase [Pseudobacteriovorax antillogorgiicola]
MNYLKYVWIAVLCSCVHQPEDSADHEIFVKPKGSLQVERSKASATFAGVQVVVEPSLKSSEFSFLVRKPHRMDLMDDLIDIVVDSAMLKVNYTNGTIYISKQPKYQPQRSQHRRRAFSLASIRDSLGVMVSSNGMKSYSCNGFFIDSRHFVSNHHCLVGSEPCDGIQITASNRKVFSCKKIIGTDQEMDYVVIETNRPRSAKNQFLEFDTKLYSFEQTDKLWVVSVRDNMELVSPCSALGNGISTNAGVLCSSQKGCRLASLLSQCSNRTIALGDSGSPVLNSKGEVIGLLWGYVHGGEKNLPAFVPSRLLKQEFKNMDI